MNGVAAKRSLCHTRQSCGNLQSFLYGTRQPAPIYCATRIERRSGRRAFGAVPRSRPPNCAAPVPHKARTTGQTPRSGVGAIGASPDRTALGNPRTTSPPRTNWSRTGGDDNPSIPGEPYQSLIVNNSAAAGRLRRIRPPSLATSGANTRAGAAANPDRCSARADRHSGTKSPSTVRLFRNSFPPQASIRTLVHKSNRSSQEQPKWTQVRPLLRLYRRPALPTGRRTSRRRKNKAAARSRCR